MKPLTTVMKILAIVLNIIVLSFGLFIISKWGFYTENLLAWVLSILFLTCYPVSLIAISFTFLKKARILTCVLKVIAVITNLSLLIAMCGWLVENSDVLGGINSLGRILLVLCFLISIINILAMALTYCGKASSTKLD